MAKFDGLRLTNAGEMFMARCVAEGIPLKITRVAIGDGALGQDEDPYQLTEMKHERYAGANVNKRVVSKDVVQVEIMVDPAVITQGFYLREMGVIVEDPDGGEILYMYENVGEFSDYIPVSRLATYMRRIYRVMVKVADSTNVYLTVINDAANLEFVNIDTPEAGAGIYAGKGVDGSVLLKRIKAGEGIEIVENDDVIIIRAVKTD